MGIGGWFISSRSVSWFAETWDFHDVQQQWPCLTKEAQRNIACFETLAQLALTRIAWATEGQAVHGLCMPSGADNTASEAGVNKLFTTAWPLQIFVQLVAAWAYKHKWSVLASPIRYWLCLFWTNVCVRQRGLPRAPGRYTRQVRWGTGFVGILILWNPVA